MMGFGFPELMIILVIASPFMLIYYFGFYREKKRRNNFLKRSRASPALDNEGIFSAISSHDKNPRKFEPSCLLL